ncbi:MAG: hypothetical protein U0X87_11330 [Anaerolineales bacterium]
MTVGEIAATSVAPAIIADLSPVELARNLSRHSVFGVGTRLLLGPLAGGWVYEHWK